MIEFLLGEHEYIPANVLIGLLLTVAAILTYTRIAFEEGPLQMFWPRSIMAAGLTLLALRFWASMVLGQEVHVPPLAMIAIGLTFGGYCVVQMRSIKRAIQVSRVNLKCFRDAELPCQREDRVREAIIKNMRGQK